MNIPGLTNVGATLLTLPPNNDYYKVGGSLMVKLPLNSTLMARANYSVLDNNIDLTQFPVPAAAVPQYHGRVTYTTASLALTSNPIKMLETRIFYNLLDKQNKSTDSFNYGGVDTEKFAYHKQNVGVDLAVKLPANTKASAGYEFQHLNRALRADAYSTTDHIVFVEAKNNALEMLTAKVRLQHMKRLSDDKLVFGTSADSRFRRYDATDKTQEAVKAGLEIEPLHNLSIGLEYAFKLDSFDNTTVGMTSNRSHEFNLDSNYTIGNLKLNAYADYEFTRYETVSRNGAFGAAVTDAVYDYKVKRENASYDYGLNVDVDIIKNVLSAGLGWRYAYSNGNESFATNRTITPLINIPADDDYTRQTLTAKLNYKFNKNLALSGGYSYERLAYSEGELNNYQNLVFAGAPTAIATGYLTGVYANQDFEAHIGFVKLAYSF
jgi:opacity protein-like surface antigen